MPDGRPAKRPVRQRLGVMRVTTQLSAISAGGLPALRPGRMFQTLLSTR